MKKIFVFAFLISLLASFRALAADGLSLSEGAGVTGDIVPIVVNMDNNGAFVGSIVIEYDNERLEFLESKFSEAFEGASPMINPEFRENQIKMNWLGMSSDIDYTNFCTISFKIKSNESIICPIKITEYKLYDENSLPITADAKNGALKINNPSADVAKEEEIIEGANDSIDDTSQEESNSSANDEKSSSSTSPSRQNTAVAISPDINSTFEESTKVIEEKTAFKDIEAVPWATDAIEHLSSLGIIEGVSKTEFAPNRYVTRAEFIAVMCRTYHIEKRDGDNFSDGGDQWYSGYLAAAKQLGITSGVGNNMFLPNSQITREEMVTLIYNYMNKIGNINSTKDNSTHVFGDNESISKWALPAVEYAYSYSIIKGRENNIFDPLGNSTRAEMTQIFYNLLIANEK